MLARFFFTLLLCFFFALKANAEQNIKLSIANFSFDDIQAENLQFDINLTSKGLALNAHADSMQLTAPIGKVTKPQLHCDELIVLSESFSCASGTLAFQQAELGAQSLSFKISAQPESSQYQINIAGLKLASAKTSATIYLNKKYWRVVANMPKLNITQLIKTATPYMQEAHIAQLENWQVDGDIKLSVDLAGRSNKLKTVALKLTPSSFNLTDEASRYVTENVTMSLDLEAKNSKQNWQWQAELAMRQGQAYGEPIFIDFEATPVNLQAEGSWHQDSGKLVVSTAEIKQKDIMQLAGDFSGSFTKIEHLNITLKKAKIAQLYAHWLQAFVVGTATDNLELAGDISAQYHQQATGYHLALSLEQIFAADALNRFSVDNITGTLGWTNYEHSMLSDLQWDQASLYAIPIGKTHVKAHAKSSSLQLDEAWNIPIFDGELQINKLDVHRPGEETVQWTFDGQLSPVSMEHVSRQLNWPELRGQLSGVIPKVNYQDKHISVDGKLTVNLFEGITTISNLKLDQPFGSLPQLYADIDLKGMNLETLTETFDFGKITGKLDGKINTLRLSNWRPVQLNAHFATPKEDKSRRRISQKAINNLSKVGGGVGGALQRSFLRFFEDFSYKRLGLSCKLRNEVCEMSGVGETEQGYYIVKGGGLPPRINVVGYTRRVDWPDLIDRLKAVSESSAPVVIE